MSDGTGSAQGFADGNTSGNDYVYDAAGSVSKDLNRGMSSISYNLLKLPRQVSFTNGKSVSYQYDAAGNKLSSSTAGEQRTYVGAVQYLNGSLFEIAHEEGRYSGAGGYEWQHRDHLGNVRVSFTGAGSVATASQYRDYDPWGWELASLSSGGSPNRATYNGKEILTELGGGLLDYGARLYDATIGRWGVVDPLAEQSRRWSGYAYGYNNPLRFVDIDGRESRDYTYSDGYSNQSYSGSGIGRDAFVEGPEGGLDQDGPGKDKPKPANTTGRPAATNTQATLAATAVATGESTAVGEVVTGIGEALLGLGRMAASGAALGMGLIAALPGIVESDKPDNDNKPMRIALGVTEQLKDFSSKVDALPYSSGWYNGPTQWELLSATIIQLGKMPNTTFHFNLSTPRGLVTDQANMSSRAGSMTTREFLLVSTMFPEKTTYYIKSGTIYKPVNKK